jgi:hypothetical protein
MTPVASFCRNCGKALTEQEKAVSGAAYCAACEPAMRPHPAPAIPSPAPAVAADPSISPGLAFLLGLLPGVGAIYNGQYAKGLVHAFVFGLFITIAESSHGMQPILAMMLAAFFIYMPFEAYHTARKRMNGEPVDEFSSLVAMKAGASGFPVGPVSIILVGIVFLLNNLEIVRFSQVVRFWPILMIFMGIYQLRQRMSRRHENQEGRDELR